MLNVLNTHIRKFVSASDGDLADVGNYYRVAVFSKKENLLQQGQVCKANYFVVKGILRKFFIDDKGVERTTEFAIENWWITDVFSSVNKTPSEFYIQAVERTEVLMIENDSYNQLASRHPFMETYFRCIYQKAYAAAQMRIKFLYENSREELYHHFRKRYPEFLQRVPQYLIASFLGLTPEYLSEIRRKSIS